jgi:hypothetical protein
MISNCVKCGGIAFEAVEADVDGVAFKMLFVQCSACGGVVGVTNYFDVADLVLKLARRLNVEL